MTRVVERTPDELRAERDAILRRHELSLDDFADLARRFLLSGEQWQAWDDLEGIAFLLHEEPAGDR